MRLPRSWSAASVEPTCCRMAETDFRMADDLELYEGKASSGVRSVLVRHAGLAVGDEKFSCAPPPRSTSCGFGPPEPSQPSRPTTGRDPAPSRADRPGGRRRRVRVSHRYACGGDSRRRPPTAARPGRPPLPFAHRQPRTEGCGGDNPISPGRGPYFVRSTSISAGGCRAAAAVRTVDCVIRF